MWRITPFSAVQAGAMAALLVLPWRIGNGRDQARPRSKRLEQIHSGTQRHVGPPRLDPALCSCPLVSDPLFLRGIAGYVSAGLKRAHPQFWWRIMARERRDCRRDDRMEGLSAVATGSLTCHTFGA